VSVILANDTRDAVRPFLVDFLVDALRAAAKEITSVDPVGSYAGKKPAVGNEMLTST
jgi:20S proteasome alpha/beta subunit